MSNRHTWHITFYTQKDVYVEATDVKQISDDGIVADGVVITFGVNIFSITTLD